MDIDERIRHAKKLQGESVDLIEYLDEKLDILRLVLLIFLTSVLVIILTFGFINKANAGVLDDALNRQGMELSAGGFSDIAPGAEDPNYDFRWLSVSLFNQHYIDNYWNVVVTGDLGYMSWSAKDNGPDTDTFSLGAQLVLYRVIYKNVSVGLGGGFCTLTDQQHLPDLGNSGLYGTITGRVKVKVSEKSGLEFAADHISDALQDGSDGDGGKNVLALKLYYMFN
jgi:hypothetical protein